MNTLPGLRISRKVYSALLLLYPASLRREFGEEMVEVFSDQLRDAHQRNGWASQVSVWCCVGGETLRAAVSGHLQFVGISVAAGLTAFGIMCTFFWVMRF